MTENRTEWIYFHNGNCSKSRQALAILLESGVAFKKVNYLEDPPSPAALLELCEKGNFDIRQLVRFGEPVAVELNLTADDQRSDDEWSRLLNKYPVLIERPILVSPTRAVVGRPPERIRELLE